MSFLNLIRDYLEDICPLRVRIGWIVLSQLESSPGNIPLQFCASAVHYNQIVSTVITLQAKDKYRMAPGSSLMSTPANAIDLLEQWLKNDNTWLVVGGVFTHK